MVDKRCIAHEQASIAAQDRTGDVHPLYKVCSVVRRWILSFSVLSLAVLALTGCATVSNSSSGSTSTSSGHVFLIMMENRSYDQALGGDYTASLASEYAVATDYHAVTHPSLPNYLALTSGSTWDITNDKYQPLPSGEDVGSELTSAGIPWKAYMEDMSNGCFDSPKPYALKHNPFAVIRGMTAL